MGMLIVRNVSAGLSLTGSGAVPNMGPRSGPAGKLTPDIAILELNKPCF